MAETVKIIEYFYATVTDKPGEARRLLEHLSEKGVNLIAFNAFPIGIEISQINLFPSDPKLLQEAAADANIELIGPKQALLIQGDDRIGALHHHHLKLANANVNVHAATGIVIEPGKYGYLLWVDPKDVRKAEEVIIASETNGEFGTLRPGGTDW
jgi:hypothetical protein